MVVATELLMQRGEDRYEMPLGPDDLQAARAGQPDQPGQPDRLAPVERIVPLAQEELRVGKVVTEDGRA